MILILGVIIFTIIFICIEYEYYRHCKRYKYKYRFNDTINAFLIEDKKYIIYLFLLALLLSSAINIIYKYIIECY